LSQIPTLLYKDKKKNKGAHLYDSLNKKDRIIYPKNKNRSKGKARKRKEK